MKLLPSLTPHYARVAVAKQLDQLLTYAIPEVLVPDLRPGHVVLVPLGKGGASETAYVIDFTDTIDFDLDKLKPITRLVDPEPAFDARQLGFFQWIADYYLAPLGMVIHTALPREVQARVVRVAEPTDAGLEALSTSGLEGPLATVLREIVSRPGLTKRGLVKRLSDIVEDPDKALDALTRRKLVEWGGREVNESRGTIRTATLTMDAEAARRAVPRSKRLAAVLDALIRLGGTADVPALTAEQGAGTSTALRTLAERGVVRMGERENRDPLDGGTLPAAKHAPVLNADQQAALAAITAPGADGTFLLWGVTGSGKTEVFLGAAKHALDVGRQVLVLVPEIGLTPLLVGRFRARFGDRVAVLHSGLTGAERLAQWRRIRSGEADVAVGARSALFAPFKDLGLVVVDEEHDDSYKQDDGVRYSARDLAVVLGRTHKCPVVLASATPSLETWYNAELGRYKRLRLPNRATPAAIPKVEAFDLTALEVPEGTERPLFHPSVVQAMRDGLADNGKVIVLYNRRGYATLVQCTSCGGTYECPNCGVTMILHRKAGLVACHYCGLKRPYDGKCPREGKATMEELGKGTERVEEVLAELFPGVPVARMDADTTAVRGSHHRLLEDFREGRARILVGTQIVAKGHDFPDVRCAVVVSADHGFRMPDFRAAERTWALLVQVSGRAGRGDKPGRVLLQTWTPDHYVMSHLSEPDGFYAQEARLRKTLGYPPFTRLVLLRIEGIERNDVQDAGHAIARGLRRLTSEHKGVDVLGPSAAAMPRLVGRWRWQIVLRGKDPKVFRAFLDQAKRVWREPFKGIRIIADVDPRHLM